jgi:hypothetical protein
MVVIFSVSFIDAFIAPYAVAHLVAGSRCRILPGSPHMFDSRLPSLASIAVPSLPTAPAAVIGPTTPIMRSHLGFISTTPFAGANFLAAIARDI